MALDKAKTAVLVIDVLVTEGDDTLYNPSPEEERVVVNSARVVDAARAAGVAALGGAAARRPRSPWPKPPPWPGRRCCCSRFRRSTMA